MSEQPSVPRHRSLSERLQSVTEALAATRTPAEVFGIVLHPALQALDAVAGVVLLVNDRGDRLEVAATQGYAEGEQTLWRSGALDDVAPAIDALRRREPVYFEHQAALIAAYPDLAAPPGGVAVVATAVIPMVLDGQALGVIVLAFTEPHHFTPEERRFLETLAAQCALALDRLQLATQLRQQAEEVQTHADTLSAFVALTEAVGTETDLSVLALRAIGVVQAAQPELGAVYYELAGALWKPRVVSEEIAPEIVAVLRAGLPLETPGFMAATQAREPIFIDGWDAEIQGVSHSESYGAGAFYPYFSQGQPFSMLTVGTQQSRTWTTRDRAMFTAVGRSLGLALERAEQARGLEEERSALAAFTAFTEAVGTQTDVTSLAQQAFTVLGVRFQNFSSGYNVLEDGLWKLRAHTDDLYATPELLGVLRAGLPQDTPSLLTMVRDRTEVFSDAEALEHDGIENSGEYGVGGWYPLMQGGEVRAFLGFGLKGVRRWSERDRALVRAVGRGLQLALERTGLARALVVQNAELDARTRALEGFAALTRNPAQPDERLALVRRAQEIVAQMIPQGFAAYYELQGEHWHLQSQAGSPNDPAIQAAMESALPYALIENFRRPWESGLPFYQDLYDPALDDGVPGVEALASTAALPLLVGERRQGIFGYGLTVRRAWSGADRAVLETLVRSLGLALERAEQTQKLDEERAALDAFVAFSEAVGIQTDVFALSQQAVRLLSLRFTNCSTGYYQLEDDQWKLRIHTDDLHANPEGLARFRAGLPRETPIFLQALQTRAAAFVDTWNPQLGQIEWTKAYGTLATYPLMQGSEVQAVLAIGLRDQQRWSERDRGVFQAVGRGLQLALERAEAARHLTQQNAELAARTRALEGFAQLTADLGVQQDRHALIRRAQEVLMSLLPPGYALFWERRGGRWFSTSQVNDVGHPQLQPVIDQGLLIGQSPTLDTPYASREPDFQNVYAQGADTVPEVVRHIGATACLPLLVGGEVLGIMAVALFETRNWNGPDRAVLEAVVQSLGLALERAQGVAELAARSQELERSNQELEAANGELEAFAYSVSHDLRTPVRHIKGFNELLRQVLGTPLDARATRYLGIVDEAAGRMNTLIDAMLELSRTSRQPLRMGPVNLETLVAAICLEVEADAQGRDVKWNVQPLPLVMGDQDTLRQVMVNLLSNALKYSRQAHQAVIEVWAEERPGEWAVFVRDNGVGFDPRYGDKLFGVFQRLHRHEEFEGTGVGLANVRRIISRHGGTVFAHSEVGQGATFGFTLPRPSSND